MPHSFADPLPGHSPAAAGLEKLLLLAATLRDRTDEENETGGSPAAAYDSDPEDLKGLSQLDPEAISQLHNRYFPVVFRFARYRLNDDALAEDVTAETFTRLLESVHAGKGPTTSPRGWLMRTAANLVNDFYRHHYGRPTEPLGEWLPSDQPGPVLAAEASEEKAELYEAFKTLTREQQEVLALRFGSGFSLAATAEVLGKNANAIKALQFRAVNALRRRMEAANG